MCVWTEVVYSSLGVGHPGLETLPASYNNYKPVHASLSISTVTIISFAAGTFRRYTVIHLLGYVWYHKAMI